MGRPDLVKKYKERAQAIDGPAFADEEQNLPTRRPRKVRILQNHAVYGAIRVGDYKLLERYEDGGVHLYDLQADIGETQDLASEHPERVGRMREALHDWYKRVDAKFLREKNGRDPWRPGDGNTGDRE